MLEYLSVARIKRLLSWWIEGLWLGLPVVWRHRLFRVRPQVVIRLVGVGEACRPDSAANATSPAKLFLDLDRPVLPESVALDTAEVCVILDRSRALTREFVLPIAAEKDLRPILQLELERLTPFSSKDLLFDFAVTERNRARGTLRVVAGLVPRSVFADVLLRLSSANVKPHIMTTAEADRPPLAINWLGPTSSVRLPFIGWPISPSLVCIAVLALCAALYAPLFRYQSLVKVHQQTANASKEAAIESRKKATAQEKVVERTTFFNQLVASHVSPLKVLAQLSSAMPDNAWVSRFTMTSSGIQVQGEASDASSLLETVSRLDTLNRAEFQSPVTLNRATGKAAFSLVAQFVSPESHP